MRNILLTSLLLIGVQCYSQQVITLNAPQELIVDAGVDVTISPNATIVLGGAPSAEHGEPPYVYNWSPQTGISDPTISNPNVTPQVNTIYVLTVTDANNCSVTDSVIVTVLSGIDDIRQNKISLYPNPVKEELHISMEDFDGVEFIKIWDVQGKLLYSEKITTESDCTIILTGLKSGEYLVQCITSTESMTQIIIKE